MAQTLESLAAVDEKLSKRHIDLDPGGYFIIYLRGGLIYANTNVINERGLAVDPETGKPIPVGARWNGLTLQVFSGRTAKEIVYTNFEQPQPCPVTRLDHAAYLGREFVR